MDVGGALNIGLAVDIGEALGIDGQALGLTSLGQALCLTSRAAGNIGEALDIGEASNNEVAVDIGEASNIEVACAWSHTCMCPPSGLARREP